MSIKAIFKVTTLFSGVQGLNILLNLLRAKLAAVLLGTAGVGLNSIFNETREFIHSSTNLGMDHSGTREIAKAAEEDRVEAVALTRTWILLLAMLGFIAMPLLSYPLSWMLFADEEHVWELILLAPAVAFSTMVCGELTVLKGLQKIRALAIVSSLNVFVGVVTTVPLYYLWGMAAIVPALILMTFGMMISTMAFSFYYCRPRYRFDKSFLCRGKVMLSIGFFIMLSGIVGHFKNVLIQSYLNTTGSLDVVGLYNAAYSICYVYAGVILTSLSTEYFPRITAVFQNKAERDDNVMKQVKVMLLLSIPISAAMWLLMPWLVPLLLTDDFSSIVPMARIIILTLPLRAVYLCWEYMPLAAGDSKTFFTLECLSNILMLLCVVAGYYLYGLIGIGYGMACMNILDFCVTWLCVRIRYDFRIR